MTIELHNGDCLEVMKSIPDGSIDCVITDPPFQVTQCKWDKIIPFDEMWEQLKRIIKPNGAIVLFGSEPFSSALRMSNIKQYKYDWVWDKVKPSGHLNAKIKPMTLIENVMVFCDGKVNYYPQMTEQKPRISKNYLTNKKDTYGKEISVSNILNQKHPKQILSFSNASQKDKFHPTQKPVALLEYLIKTYTQEGETVLDFTMGSGSTMIACLNTNRKGIGIELDKHYFDVASKRITDHQATLESGFFIA